MPYRLRAGADCSSDAPLRIAPIRFDAPPDCKPLPFANWSNSRSADPSPDEIAARAAEIREGWTEQDEWQRAPWAMPVPVQLSETHFGG
jgi:hypothetical protein